MEKESLIINSNGLKTPNSIIIDKEIEKMKNKMPIKDMITLNPIEKYQKFGYII